MAGQCIQQVKIITVYHTLEVISLIAVSYHSRKICFIILCDIKPDSAGVNRVFLQPSHHSHHGTGVDSTG